jgi:precorrin-2 dehydrogenase/sirohydrochlorin ferrochelatase
MRKYYPVFLEVEGRSCLVVGGGNVASRKAKSLSDAGARVKVISPQFCKSLLNLAEKGRAVLDRKRFRAKDLDRTFLAIACTDDDKVNDRVCAAARRRGVLVNVVDSPDRCDFIVPSVVSRGALNIAISTSGVSPALCRRMRQELEQRYGERYADFLELMEKSRSRIIREVPKMADRKLIFDALTDRSFLGKFLKESRAEAKKLFTEKLKRLLPDGSGNHV